MNVFIAHALQDKDQAATLAEALRLRGFRVELETGEGAMRPLGPNDAAIGLISKDFVFSPFKLRLEKRLLDAWADEQLVMVKLDNAFAPVGLRDLPSIDASFEAQREFAWIKVCDAVRALTTKVHQPSEVDAFDGGVSAPPSVAASAPMPAPMAPQPPAEWRESYTRSEPGYGPEVRRRTAAKKSAGAGGFLLLTLLLAGAGGAGYYFLKPQKDAPSASVPNAIPIEIPSASLEEPVWRALLIGGAIMVGLLIMAFIATRASKRAALERRMGKPSKSAARQQAGGAAAANPKPAAPAPSAPKAEPAPAKPLIFISYARADEDSVDPLADAVRDSGRSVWIDTQEIDAGTSWAGEIVRAIKSAGHVLIMCSPRSFESDQVKREVYLADRYKKPLMPVFLEAAEPPEDFEYFFAGVQWLKLHEAPEGDRPGLLTRALPAA